MIEIPFRFPWRALGAAMLAGLLGGWLVYVQMLLLQVALGAAKFDLLFTTWLAPLLVLEGCLAATLMLHLMQRPDGRVWWTLPATTLSIVFGWSTMSFWEEVSAYLWAEMLPYRAFDGSDGLWQMRALETFVQSLPFLLVDMLLYGMTAWLILRYTWTWILGGTLWVAAIILALVMGMQYLTWSLDYELFLLWIFPWMVWAQCFWIGLPGCLKEAHDGVPDVQAFPQNRN